MSWFAPPNPRLTVTTKVCSLLYFDRLVQHPAGSEADWDAVPVRTNELVELAALLRNRNAIDNRMSKVIHPPDDFGERGGVD